MEMLPRSFLLQSHRTAAIAMAHERFMAKEEVREIRVWEGRDSNRAGLEAVGEDDMDRTPEALRRNLWEDHDEVMSVHIETIMS